MKIITSPQEMLQHRATINDAVGFVPTLGSLHQGHQSLLERSCHENSITILSIFLNPTQFNQSSDLSNYPVKTEQDCQLAKACGVDIIFMPDSNAMYPCDYHYQIHENHLSQTMEGITRPGHFTGMLTIVMKLLLLTQPTRAYFGEKDHQQLQLVQGLVDAFFLKCDIIACATIRDPSGLPYSSRNARLSESGLTLAKQAATTFHQAKSLAQAKQLLENLPVKIEYLEEYQQRRYVAFNIEGIRIIDNTPIGEK